MGNFLMLGVAVLVGGLVMLLFREKLSERFSREGAKYGYSKLFFTEAKLAFAGLGIMVMGSIALIVVLFAALATSGE